ncbi:hypothetical protein AB0J80_34435 [Actinoplanes sp. NPDC049548]|uniref:hypothetical protein n=1 Tax=Actinoplanes sp. NPDC049548 TaxID=3155152 RepID=UPI00341C125F
MPVKEQARQRRIPYCWIGGTYRFTDEHITAIVRLYEVEPEEAYTSTSSTGRVRRPEAVSSPARVATQSRQPTMLRLGFATVVDRPERRAE